MDSVSTEWILLFLLFCGLAVIANDLRIGGLHREWGSWLSTSGKLASRSLLAAVLISLGLVMVPAAVMSVTSVLLGWENEAVASVPVIAKADEMRWLLVVIIMPFIEELIFRMGGFRILLAKGFSAGTALAITSVAFGIIHVWNGTAVVGGGAQVVLATFFGLFMGWLYMAPRFGFACAVLAHMTHNAIIIALRNHSDAVDLWVLSGAASLALVAGIMLTRDIRREFASPLSKSPVIGTVAQGHATLLGEGSHRAH